MSNQTSIYRFGSYELRTRTRELYTHGIRLKVRPQPLRILQILVERAGDLVTREELHQALWMGTSFVDFEHGLNNSIKELRAVLSDSATDPKYIETMPRLGYRFLVSVQPVEPKLAHGTLPSATPEMSASTQMALSDRSRPSTLNLGRLVWPVVGGLGLAIGTLLFLWFVRSSSQANGHAVLAVLPFENLTGDVGQEYLGDGLTEELISQLGQIDSRRLGVIGRTSVMHYKNNHSSVEEIGRSLQAQFVVEGSIRRDSGRVCISARLVDVKGRTLWSREYDRETSDLLTIQREIAHEISDEILMKLGGSEPAIAAKTAPANATANEAYDFYLRGTYFLNKRNVPGLRQAASYFEETVVRDPSYAPAHAALANCYTLLGEYSGGMQTQYIPQARKAAMRALQLDSSLPEAHVALALIAQNYDWDWATAEKEYRRAIELNPNYATAHHWYAEHLAYRGQFQEALAEYERAHQIEPLSLIIAADRGVTLYYARQYDESIKQFRAVRDMEPHFVRAGMVLYPQVAKGMYTDALEFLRQEREAHGENAWYWARTAYVEGRSGHRGQAQLALKKLQDYNRRQASDPGILLWANLALGNREQAFLYMEQAYAQHSSILVTLKVEPAFDPLRGDPRFLNMLERIHLN